MANMKQNNELAEENLPPLTAESFKVKAIQAAREMLENVECMTDLAILIENKVKKIVKKFDVDFEDCALDECSAMAFTDRAGWEFGLSKESYATPNLMYSWEKDAYMYILTIRAHKSKKMREASYMYELRRVRCGRVPEVFNPTINKWITVPITPSSLDIARAFLAECPKAEEQDLDFLENAAKVSHACDVQDLRRIMENSMTLMKLYRQVSDFMDLDCMQADGEDPYLTLIPDDPFKCGCAVCERDGKYVLQQCCCEADMLGLDPDDPCDWEAMESMKSMYFINDIAVTDNMEVLTHLLGDMFGAYRKGSYCILPLSMQAYCCIALPLDEEPEFYTLNDQDLTKQEVDNFIQGLDGLANILPE